MALELDHSDSLKSSLCATISIGVRPDEDCKNCKRFMRKLAKAVHGPAFIKKVIKILKGDKVTLMCISIGGMVASHTLLTFSLSVPEMTSPRIRSPTA